MVDESQLARLRDTYLRSGISGVEWESLQNGTPNAKSLDRRTNRLLTKNSVDVHDVREDRMDDYWEIYTEFPIVRESIRAFASEVVAPGIIVEAPSEAEKDELEEWLKTSVIANGEVGKDFTFMVKDLIVQREVRGTALIEKVKEVENPDNLWGFKPIPVHTVKQYTLPGQSILVPPDADLEGLGLDPSEFKLTEDGEVAAYVQFDDSFSAFRTQDERRFTREDIIKLVRDADVGEVFGTSRLEAICDHIVSLLDKKDANDKAIESMAWKFWLIKFGNADTGLWPASDIESFMNNHRSSDFQPGMKQGVQGDVDIQTVEGEVAEGLEKFLDFDIDMIVSGLPMPKYALGSFEENVNQFVSRSQETVLRNQIREARREIEAEFTPALRQKAEELGINPEEVELIIDDSNDLMSDMSRPPASTEDPFRDQRNTNRRPQEDNEDESEETGTVWDYDSDIELLADPRFVSTRTENRELTQLSESVLKTVRNTVVERVEQEAPRMLDRAASGRFSVSGNEVARLVDNEVTRVLRSSRVSFNSKGEFNDVVKKTVEKLSTESNDIDGTFGFEERDSVRVFTEDYSLAVTDASEHMARRIRNIVKTGIDNNESAEVIGDRVFDVFTDSKIRQTSGLISQMSVQNAIETTRLREYEKAPSVIGVEVLNNCSETTTPLCRELGGCNGGEAAQAFFGSEDIGDQLEAQVPDNNLFVGFNPLPANPPFHFGCTSELAPIFDDGDTLAKHIDEEEEDEEELPFAGFDDFSDCVSKIMSDQDVGREEAENICGKIKSESEDE